MNIMVILVLSFKTGSEPPRDAETGEETQVSDNAASVLQLFIGLSFMAFVVWRMTRDEE